MREIERIKELEAAMYSTLNLLEEIKLDYEDDYMSGKILAILNELRAVTAETQR